MDRQQLQAALTAIAKDAADKAAVDGALAAGVEGVVVILLAPSASGQVLNSGIYATGRGRLEGAAEVYHYAELVLEQAREASELQAMHAGNARELPS